MRVSIKTRETVGDVVSQSTVFFDKATVEDVVDTLAGLDSIESGSYGDPLAGLDEWLNDDEPVDRLADAKEADRYHHDFLQAQADLKTAHDFGTGWRDRCLTSEGDLNNLIRAVAAVYRAAWWQADRPCDAEALWENLRKMTGIPAGTATEALGAPPITALDLKDANEPPLFLALVNFFRDTTLASEGGATDSGLAYETAKMFMARWRRSVGKPREEDAKYLERYERLRAKVNDMRAAKLRVDESRLTAGPSFEDCCRVIKEASFPGMYGGLATDAAAE